MAQSPDAIRLQVLGTVDLRDPRGRELRKVLVQPKRLALLTYLAVARPRGFHRRESLLPIFWPELSDSRARHALRQSLHFLRQALGSDVIVTRGAEEVGVNPDALECDAVRFENLVSHGHWERAVELYGGPLLNAVAVGQSPEFERWLDSERLRLGDAYVQSLDGLVSTAEGSDPTATVTWLRRRVEHDPYDPEANLRLMRALESANDRPGALQLAKVYRGLVERDLGDEPDPRVTAFADRLAVDTPVPDPVSSSVVPVVPARRSLGWRGPVAAGIGALAVASGIWLGVTRSAGDATPTGTTTTLIVAPFVTLADSADRYLADGIAAGVYRRLSALASLRTIGWVRDDVAAAETLTTALVDPREALVLQGSLQRDRLAADSSRVRVVATITRFADGAAVWRGTFDEDFSDLSALERDVARDIVDGLNVPILADERVMLDEAPTGSAEAYEHYLLGVAALNRESWMSREWTAFGQKADLARAVAHFERALALDSAFIDPLARLAIANTSMFHWRFDRTPSRLTRAKEAMDRAMRFRPDLAVTHLAAAWYYYLGDFNYNRALRHLTMANSGWRGSAEVSMLTAGIRRRQGDLQQARLHYNEAARQSGICPECLAELAYTEYVTGNVEQAEEMVAQALSLAPELHLPRHVGAMLQLTNYNDSAGALALLQTSDPAPDAMMHLVTGRWAFLPRILNRAFDAPLERLTLYQVRADTGGYYLAKASLASRRGHREVAESYYDSARVALESLAGEAASDPLIRSELGLAYAGLGQRAAAVREGTMAVRLRPISQDALDGPLYVQTLAEIYMLLGEFDAAVGQLEDMIEQPGWMTQELLRLDPLWKPLHGHPRFAALIGGALPT